MRAVVQRAAEASVAVDGEVIGRIGRGLVVFLGVETGDSEDDAAYMAEKLLGLRCFQDESSKFNLSVRDVAGGFLVVSQFTLHGDCRKGRRPSFTQAARPELAVPLYESVVRRLAQSGSPVATGSFGAHMDVLVMNDGPVTLLIDSKKVF